LDEEPLLETPLLEAGEDNPDKELSSRGVSTDALEEKPPINEPDAETETLALVSETPPQEARPKIQTLSLASGHEFVIERLTGDDVIPHPLPVGTHSTVYVALEPFLVETLTIRTERPGDRFHPMGSMTSMRLTSYLTKQLGEKRPKSNNTPVLACGDEILWAVGVGVAEALRVTRRPTHRLSWVTAATPSSPSVSKTELATV
jgi:hypothetical protein